MGTLSMQDKVRIFRERFYGRQDVFARRWESRRHDGTTAAGFAPVCSNLWKDGCHLRMKDGVLCDSCEIKQYVPVSDETVLKHIQNIEQHVYYVLLPDGKIMFGALDFDLKPGKEHLGYTWEDVKAVKAILNEWGVPHAVARSTGNGFHTYMFFSEPYPASRFRAVMIEIFERAGFMELMRQGIKTLPEMFPKQAYVSADGVGNGIKPPCIEPRWAAERNGFVDDNNIFIPPEQQWQFLDSTPRIPPAMFDEIIVKHEIPVYEDSPTTSTTSGGAPTNGERRRNGKWQPPLTGSIEKVLAACPAFRKIGEKVAKGEMLGHNEGFALYRMAMSTADGVAWFTQNVKGWGTNPAELKQLEHSLKKNYAPDTCKKLQEAGVCVPGTKCLSKKPPIDQVEGQTVVRTDLPESQWPEPSPIRFAFSTGDDFIDKLKEETAALKEEKDHKKLLEALEKLAYRAQVFDDDQIKDYKAFVRGLKLVKPGEFSKLFSAASEAAQKDTEKTLGDRSDIIETHGNHYQKLSPFGYAVAKPSRRGTKTTNICLADIDIKEERAYIDDGRVVRTVFAGTCRGAGVEKEFEIAHDKWIENSDFAKYFLATLGNVFNIQRPNIDAIRQAAVAFSQREGITKSSHLITQGWYGQSYLTPTVIVDKDGVRPNTEQHVTLAGKEHSKNLDFSLLSDSLFSETMLHIKKDLLNAWPRFWVTFGLSHTLLPCILKPMELNQKRPTLFYEGLTGSGKTEITHLLQQFWGQFDAPLNLTSTAKGIQEEAYQFKDAILVVDDYKGVDRAQIDALKRVIQYCYDGTKSAKCNRDSTLQKEKMSRATLMMSGEHFLQSEASAVARTILLEVDKYNTVKTREAYTKSWQMAKHYRGITPRFIHWFLNQDMAKYHQMFEKFHTELQTRTSGKQNASRIATNLSLSYLVWNLWVSFMVDNGVADRKEGEELLSEHWGYILNTQDNMLGRCEEEQSAVVFLRVLRQLIAAKEVSVHNLDGYYNERKQQIGFASPSQHDVINLFPDVSMNLVRMHTRDIGFSGSDRSVARQLIDMGVISQVDPSRLSKLVRYGQTRQRVWPIKKSELGFDLNAETTLKVVPAVIVPIAGAEPKMDENGIY